MSSLSELEKIEKATLSLYRMDPETDAPLDSGDPIVSADLIHVQSLQMPQEERIQTVMSSADDGKMLFYGRSTRVYGVSGFLVDSQLDRLQGNRKDDKRYAGHLMTRWDHLYNDFFRITVCVRNSWIVRFRFRKSTLYGHLLSNIKGMEATAPSVCLINFTFLSLYENEDVVVPTTSDGETEFVGTVSGESFTSIVGKPPKDFKKPLEARYTAVGLFMEEREAVPPVVMEYDNYSPRVVPPALIVGTPPKSR